MKTLHFVNYGQDFLEWDIDDQGTVIDCRPFQKFVWVGCTVTNHADMRRGALVEVERIDPVTKERLQKFITYPVEAVTHLLPLQEPALIGCDLAAGPDQTVFHGHQATLATEAQHGPR